MLCVNYISIKLGGKLEKNIISKEKSKKNHIELMMSIFTCRKKKN